MQEIGAAPILVERSAKTNADAAPFGDILLVDWLVLMLFLFLKNNASFL